jgi:hypothetical protein
MSRFGFLQKRRQAHFPSSTGLLLELNQLNLILPIERMANLVDNLATIILQLEASTPSANCYLPN